MTARLSLIHTMVAVGALTPTAWGLGFQGLGDLGGSFSSAAAVSGNGLVVVGTSRDSDGFDLAYRWTLSNAMQSLGDLPGSVTLSHARAVSADGSVIVGDGLSNNGQEAFRWTQQTGMVPLGDLDGGSFRSIANAVSADGSVVVGQATSARTEAFRWTQSEGLVGLGVLPGGGTNTIANAISANGNTVAGFAASGPNFQAFRWDQANGMVGLGGRDDGTIETVSANGMSQDGLVIVGIGGQPGVGGHGFRTTPDGQIAGIGLLPNDAQTQANAVSADGSVIVGENPLTDSDAFIWDQTHGIRRIKDILATNPTANAQASGWQLKTATGISDDGGVIVGTGINPSGQTQAWIFTLGARWASESNGFWNTSSNWLGQSRPTTDDDVAILPANGVTVTGPANTTTIGRLTIGAVNSGVAVLSLNGGTIIANQATTFLERGALNGRGTYNAIGGVVNHGDLTLDPQTQLIGGTLVNHGIIRNGTIGNTLDNASDGQLRILPNQSLAFTGTNNTNHGRITLLGGNLEFSQGFINQTGGLISGGGVLATAGQGLTNHGSIAWSADTSVLGDVTNPGDGQIIITGNTKVTFFDDFHGDGLLRITGGSTAVFFGQFSGNGGASGAGSVFIEGDLRPGNSPDRVEFTGDLIMGTGSLTQIEIAGTTPETQHDQIVVGGLLSAAGTFEVLLIDGFEPSLGQTFDVLEFGSATGMFDAIILPGLAPGLVWDHTSLLADGTLTVIPEPAAACLVIGLAAMIRPTRQRMWPNPSGIK